MKDLKLVYQAVNREAAENALDALKDKWGEDYPIVIKSWRDSWERLSAYFQYSEHIRRIIYTTNTVEGYHRQLRKVTKNKGGLHFRYVTGEACLSGVYKNQKKVDPAGAELGTDGTTAGNHFPGQVQNSSLKGTFIWSSLMILIN